MKIASIFLLITLTIILIPLSCYDCEPFSYGTAGSIDDPYSKSAAENYCEDQCLDRGYGFDHVEESPYSGYWGCYCCE